MNELKNIASLVEEELNKFQIDNEVDVRFSNFSENTDIQINSLLTVSYTHLTLPTIYSV